MKKKQQVETCCFWSSYENTGVQIHVLLGDSYLFTWSFLHGLVNLFSLFTDPTDCFAAEGVKNARKGGGFKEAG